MEPQLIRPPREERTRQSKTVWRAQRTQPLQLSDYNTAAATSVRRPCKDDTAAGTWGHVDRAQAQGEAADTAPPARESRLVAAKRTARKRISGERRQRREKAMRRMQISLQWRWVPEPHRNAAAHTMSLESPVRSAHQEGRQMAPTRKEQWRKETTRKRRQQRMVLEVLVAVMPREGAAPLRRC